MLFKKVLFIILAVSMLLVSQAAYSEKNTGNIIVFLRDGSEIIFDGKKNKLSTSYFPYRIESYKNKNDGKPKWTKKLNEPPYNFQDIELLIPDLQNYTKTKILITKTDGSQIVEDYADFYWHTGSNSISSGTFKYYELSPVTDEWEKIEKPINLIKSIHIGYTKLKINPKTGRKYPADMKFDPYDGSLLLVSPN